MSPVADTRPEAAVQQDAGTVHATPAATARPP